MATAIGVAGLVIGGLGIKQGRDNAKSAESAQNAQNAKQAEYDAKHAAAIKEQSEQEAAKIRAEAIKIRGEQVAQQASSGVLVGNGSTRAMVDETIRLAEQDSYMTLYNGEQGYLFTMEQSRLNSMEGRARANSIRQQGQASLLSGTASLMMSGYQMMK